MAEEVIEVRAGNRDPQFAGSFPVESRCPTWFVRLREEHFLRRTVQRVASASVRNTGAGFC
jgi:hypothetical protein